MSDEALKDEVIIYWSQDAAFITEMPALPGCLADGTTPQEALSNVHVIAPEWIDTAQEFGRTILQPKGRLLLAHPNQNALIRQ